MDKSKTVPQLTLQESLKTLSVDSKSLLAKTALDNLKVSKSLGQLSELLKRKNESAKPILPEQRAEK